MAAEDLRDDLDGEDLFDFPEAEVGRAERRGATAPLAEEDLDDVLQAARDLQQELGDDDAEADDEYSARFPKGMLDGEDGDDLFSFDDLLSDEGSPELDESILEEERTGSNRGAAPERSEVEPRKQASAAPATREDEAVAAPQVVKAVKPVKPVKPVSAEAAATEPRPQVAEKRATTKKKKSTRAPKPSAFDETGPSAPSSPTGRGRTFWTIVGGVAALNVTILVIGLAAVLQIGDGLRDVNTSLASSLRTIAEESRSEPVIVQLPASTPEVAAVPVDAPGLAPETTRTVPPLVLEPRERTELRAAHEEIVRGRFAAARRRLYRLLAVADSPLSEAGRSAEQEANLLIAESYEAEATALADAAKPGEKP